MNYKILSRLFAPRTIVLLVFFSVLYGCGVHFTKLNPYKDLSVDQFRNHEVKKIAIVKSDSFLVAPGRTFPIGVTAFLPREKTMSTRGLLKGYVNWNSYNVVVKGGTFENGIVTVKAQTDNLQKEITIIVTPYLAPQLKQVMSIPLNYAVPFTANCNGKEGVEGIKGLDGESARSLEIINPGFNLYESQDIEIYDPSYVENFGNGYDGKNGQVGEDGGKGDPSGKTEVYVRSYPNPYTGKKMMSVLAVNYSQRTRQVFWIDPEGGSLLVNANGGNGGTGGMGGNGGNGGNGRCYSPAVGPNDPEPSIPQHYGSGFAPAKSVEPTVVGDGGNGGFGGNGGKGGDGGNGGTVIIHLDSSAVQWKNLITVTNKGGQKGKPGQGGYAGKGGYRASIVYGSKDGATGYVGAPGLKTALNGKDGQPVTWITESINISW